MWFIRIGIRRISKLNVNKMLQLLFCTTLFIVASTQDTCDSCGPQVNFTCDVTSSETECYDLGLSTTEVYTYPDVASNLQIEPTNERPLAGPKIWFTLPWEHNNYFHVKGFQLEFWRLGVSGKLYQCHVFDLRNVDWTPDHRKVQFEHECQSPGSYLMKLQSLPYPGPEYRNGTITRIINVYDQSEAQQSADRWQPSLLYIHNDTCSIEQSITVTFEKAPDEFNIDKYQVQLKRIDSVYADVTLDHPKEVGIKQLEHTFKIEDKELKTTIYEIIIRPKQTSDCGTSCKCPLPGNCCTCSFTSTSTIAIHNQDDTSACPPYIYINKPEDNKTLIIALSVLFGVMLAMLAAFVWMRCTRKRESNCSDTEDGESLLGKDPKEVLVVYSYDNEWHKNVVQKFIECLKSCGGNVLSEFILCHDIAEEKRAFINKREWYSSNVEKCDRIIIIESEGSALKDNRIYDRSVFETKDLTNSNLGDTYSGFVGAIGELKPKRCVYYVFEYTDRGCVESVNNNKKFRFQDIDSLLKYLKINTNITGDSVQKLQELQNAIDECAERKKNLGKEWIVYHKRDDDCYSILEVPELMFPNGSGRGFDTVTIGAQTVHNNYEV